MVKFSADIFTDNQKKRLNAARRPVMDFENNKELDIVIAQIKSESPHLFWTPDTLILRKFFDQPLAAIPYRSHVMQFERKRRV